MPILLVLTVSTHIDASMPATTLPHFQGPAERAILAAEGNAEIIAALADGANPPDYSRALHLAATHGYPQCVDLLIPLVDSSWVCSGALCQAAANGHAECMRLLIPSCNKGPSALRALYLAAQRGHAGCVALLMPFVDFSEKNSIWGPIWIAARVGHVECVRLLLPTVASNDDASRALCAAAWAGEIECLKLLLSSLSLNQKALSDALVAAAANGHVDCSKLLIPGAKGRGCLAALKGAAENGYSEVLSLLLAKPVMASNSLAASLAKSRALCLAARNGHADAAKLLLPFCPSLLIDREPLAEALAQGRSSVARAMFEREPLLASVVDLQNALLEARSAQHEDLATFLVSIIEHGQLSAEVELPPIPTPAAKARL